MNTQVYPFGGGVANPDTRTRDKTIVGGKGANLAEMAGIGLPVPPGFTIVNIAQLNAKPRHGGSASPSAARDKRSCRSRWRR